MEEVFKQFPKLDWVWVRGEDYYISEPKHLKAEDLEMVFRSKEAEAKYAALQGKTTNEGNSERISELSLELEDVKADLVEAKAEIVTANTALTESKKEVETITAQLVEAKAEIEKLKGKAK